MAIASKIIAELEIIIESRAAIAMTTNGTTGAESYRKEVEYQVDRTVGAGGRAREPRAGQR